MHEGVTEDGVLSTCGICGCQVYMLDPAEMDWICDPCSMDGWSGIRKAYRLRRGDVISWGGRRMVILQEEDWGKRRVFQVRKDDGTTGDLVMRSIQAVYIHTDRDPSA